MLLDADCGSLHSVMHQRVLIPWSIAGFGKLKVVQVVTNVPALYGNGWFIQSVPGYDLLSHDSIFHSHIIFL